jgi:hypothetical protein
MAIFLIAILIFSSFYNITFQKHISTDTYVIESWIKPKQLDNILQIINKNHNNKQINLFMIGRSMGDRFHIPHNKIIKQYQNINFRHFVTEPNGQNRTFRILNLMKNDLRKDNINLDNFIIYTSNIHSKRFYFIAKKIFKNSNIGIKWYIENNNSNIISNKNWYKSSENFKKVIMESISLYYSYIKYLSLFSNSNFK